MEKISSFCFDGRRRPREVVLVVLGLERRVESVEENAREEEVEISRGFVLGRWCG